LNDRRLLTQVSYQYFKESRIRHRVKRKFSEKNWGWARWQRHPFKS